MAPVNANAVSIGVLDPRIHTKFVFLTSTGVMENGKRYTYCFLIPHSARNVKCSSTYRFAMHFSAKRGLAIACRLSVSLSVCPSVCNVGGLWSHRLEFLGNFTISYQRMFALCRPKHQGSTPRRTHRNVRRHRGGVLKKWLSAYKTSNISETRQDRTKVTIEGE